MGSGGRQRGDGGGHADFQGGDANLRSSQQINLNIQHKGCAYSDRIVVKWTVGERQQIKDALNTLILPKWFKSTAVAQEWSTLTKPQRGWTRSGASSASSESKQVAF